MSSLIFYIDEDQALVVTDTLSVTTGGQPTNFTSKALYLPHLRLVVAGTGHGGFHDRWTHQINFLAVVRDLEDLDATAPAKLRELWEEANATLKEMGRTTTIYHFGVTEAGQVAAYAYRSENDFRSERLEPGTGIKPVASVPDGNLLEGIETIMEEQRRRQEAKPAAERVHIGGEAIAIYLTPAECRHWTLFRFQDFEQMAGSARAALVGGAPRLAE